MVRDGDSVVVHARGAAEGAACPSCTTVSASVHGRYRRQLIDSAIAGSTVLLRLLVRRFRCRREDCNTVTFAEQFDGLTAPHVRFSPPARRALTAVAVALAGRAGARLAQRLGISVGRDTMLKLLRAVPDPEPDTIEILGIDDFALRRGQVYGTVLLDMITGRPVEVLPGRDADPVAAWLREHPGVRVVCRDRAGAYAAAARAGAPSAIQCADRWHLWHNLAEHVERAVTRHHNCFKQVPSHPTPDEPTEVARPTADPLAATPADRSAPAPDPGLATRIRERFATIQALHADGHGVRDIARQLRLDRKTVRRFTQASDVEGLVAKAVERDTLLDQHKPYLQQRRSQGCRDVAVLHAELQQRGYRGSIRTLYRYLRPSRTPGQATTNTGERTAPPKIRHVTTWLLRRPEDLDTTEHATLAAVRSVCPHLDRLGEHITAFAKMMVHRTGADTLDTWLAAIEADDIPELHTFARGIRQDYAAVRNGLSLPYNSGRCEGAINKLKTVKRQMYGRAGFSLLRKRILLNA